ncbi:hypothetical protein EGM51_08165 [Verrucomicrobia bacterium S94]|nr:hypothetical protein EGM51_08165 [Verrucomicrobia bacterium S94]
MGRKIRKPKEELAPSYFVQFASLWCILLGFFVMLMSLGSTQMGPGTEGLGEVRDAFGTTGGLGLLPFARNALFGSRDGSASSFRIRKSAPNQTAEVDGYIRGMLWKKGLSNISMISVVHTHNSLTVILQIPVEFMRSDKLNRESVKLLEMLGEVFLSLREYEMEVIAVCDEGEDPVFNQRQALLRAAVVARFLTETAGLLPEYVHAVGLSDTCLLDLHGIEHVKDHVLISIKQETP